MGASGLGALLVKEGFLTEQDRVTITKTCGQGSWAFAKCILSTGLLDEDELSAFFAERTKYIVAPKNLLDRLDPGIIEQVDRRMVSRLEVLPLEVDHHRITVAVADPLDKSTLKQLEFFTGLEVVPVIAPLSQIYEGLNRLNPEFKARPTALSNFLRNHAGAAWIKQKIVEEGDVDLSQHRQPARPSALAQDDSDSGDDGSLDAEIDAIDDSTHNLNDIDAGGLDEGIGNSDFDDIDLEDTGSDLELAPGDDPDASAADDAGLDIDDPFDNFEDAPKARQVASVDDNLEGLETGDDANDDLWPDADDAPAKPAEAAPTKPAALRDDDLEAGDDIGEDLWPDVDAEPAKPAAAAKPKPSPPVAQALNANKDEADDLWPDIEAGPGEAAASAKSKPAPSVADDLVTGGDGLDDFELDDEPAPRAEKAAGDFELDDEPAPAKRTKKAAGGDGLDDFELDDVPAPRAKKAAGGFELDDEPASSAKKAAGGDGLDDFELDDEPAPNAKKAAGDFELNDEPAPAKRAKKAPDVDSDVDDDLLGETPDLAFDDEGDEKRDDIGLGDLNFDSDENGAKDSFPKKRSTGALELDEDASFDDDAPLADIDSLLDEPAPSSKSAGKDLHGFAGTPARTPAESTRMAQKPAWPPASPSGDDDLASVEFAEDEETSVSLRKAVHEDGVLPEFNDPNSDGEAEDTRIDLHAAVEDDLQFDDDEETSIRLHPVAAAEKPKREPAFNDEARDRLEDLPMGFNEDESFDGPAIEDLEAAELDDIPIERPDDPPRAGGHAVPSVSDNGSVASLTSTAKANEALLRMSLCFDRGTALEIAREYLPQISETGCLVDIGKTTEALATWRRGAESKGGGQAAAFQRMSKAAKSGQWSEVPVQKQDDLFGSLSTVSVYKIQKADGSILLLAGDYPIEDDSLREALRSFAEQLGSK